MATTENNYTGTTATTYSFTFPYIKETDVKVSKNGDVLDKGSGTDEYTQATTSITLNSAPQASDEIRIYRVTSDSDLTATFYPGSAIRSADLNDNFTQNLYTTQEVVSRYLDKQGTIAWESDMDAQSTVNGVTTKYSLKNLKELDAEELDIGSTGVNVAGPTTLTGNIDVSGNATFASTIVSGADPYNDQANVGQRMDPSSGIIARSAGSNQLWTGYQTGSGDVKSEIKADGSAAFDGVIDTDVYFRRAIGNDNPNNVYLGYSPMGAVGYNFLTKDSGGNLVAGITTTGAATFNGSVQLGTGVPGDNSGSAAGTLINNGSIETQAASGNVFIGRQSSNGAATSTIGYTGDAWCAGSVQSGGYPYEGNANGSALMSGSGCLASYTNTASFLWRGYTTGTSDPTSSITAGGAASFAGKVESNYVGGNCFEADGSFTSGNAAFRSRNLNASDSGTYHFYADSSDGKLVTISTDGSATFAGVVQSGNDPNPEDGTTPSPGTKLADWGTVFACNAGTSSVFAGYTTGDSDPKILLFANGNATFDGTVTANGYSGNGIVTSGTSTSDTEVYSAKYSEAIFLRQDTSELLKSNVSWSANDTHVATTSAIDARIIDLVDKVGGFVAIADEASFPPANPDINDPPGAGTIVSITALSTNRTADGSGVLTTGFATDETTPEQVTITGCGNGQVFAAGYGLLVQTTATEHTYSFVRYVPDTSQIATVAANTADIDTVAEDLELGADSKITIVAESTYKGKVETVAGNTTAINNITDNLTAVQNAATNATTATTQAGLASDAKTGAETAKTGAETAKTGAETAQTAAELAETNAEAARDLAKTYKDLANQSHSDAQSLITQENSTAYNLADNVSSHTEWGNLDASIGVFADEAVTDTLLTMTTGTSTYDYGDLS